MRKSYVQDTRQIVWTTKHRQPTLDARVRPRLFAYWKGTAERMKCELLAAGGVEDHIHLIVSLHPSVALADFVHDLKLASHNVLKGNPRCPLFTRWQVRYSCFTYATEARRNLKRYVLNQEAHHAHLGLVEELQRLYREHGLEWSTDVLE